MSSLNRVTLMGRLGQDPTIRYTQAGTAVSNFSVATDTRWRNKDNELKSRTEWHKIVAWGKLAETVGEYLAKGRLILIEGSLQTRDWTDNEGNKRRTTEVVARNIQFADRGKQQQQSQQPSKASAEDFSGAQEVEGEVVDNDDNLDEVFAGVGQDEDGEATV